jgi:hypothetical protein
MTEPRGLKRKCHRDAVAEIVRQCLELLEQVSGDLAKRGYQSADREAKDRIMREAARVIEELDELTTRGEGR